MLLKVNTLQYTCTEKYRNLMSRYVLVSCTTLNTQRWPRTLGEEPNINDKLNPKEMSGSQWDGKRFHLYTYLARLYDVYRHCFSRKHEPQNRVFCNLFSIFFNFSKRLFICAKKLPIRVRCVTLPKISDFSHEICKFRRAAQRKVSSFSLIFHYRRIDYHF